MVGAQTKEEPALAYEMPTHNIRQPMHSREWGGHSLASTLSQGEEFSDKRSSHLSLFSRRPILGGAQLDGAQTPGGPWSHLLLSPPRVTSWGPFQVIYLHLRPCLQLCFQGTLN